MKNKYLLIASLLILVTFSSVNAGSNYASVGISVVDTDEIDGSGVGPLLKLGHFFGDSKNAFGLEIEANPMRADMQDDHNATYSGGSSSSSGMGGDIAITFGTSLVYNYNILDTGFSIRPKIGVLFPNIGDDIYKDSTTFSYGGSVLYDFGGADGYISYDTFGSGTNRYSLGIAFEF